MLCSKTPQASASYSRPGAKTPHFNGTCDFSILQNVDNYCCGLVSGLRSHTSSHVLLSTNSLPWAPPATPPTFYSSPHTSFSLFGSPRKTQPSLRTPLLWAHCLPPAGLTAPPAARAPHCPSAPALLFPSAAASESQRSTPSHAGPAHPLTPSGDCWSQRHCPGPRPFSLSDLSQINHHLVPTFHTPAPVFKSPSTWPRDTSRDGPALVLGSSLSAKE